jgi:trehalose-phosphatase
MQLACKDSSLHERIHQARAYWLFIDYDGTIADFAANPDIVIPDSDLIRLIFQLSRHPAIRVAIVSGRRLQHIRRLVPVTGIWLAGTYGIELFTPAGAEIKLLDFDKVRPLLDRLKAEWEGLIAGRSEFYLEDKGWTLAIHARLAEQEIADEVISSARKLAIEEVSDSGLNLLGGHKFLEVCPSTIDKGKTVEYLLATDPLPEALPVYIGDDDKDELGFAAVKLNGGVAILVAHREAETRADCLIASPAAVRSFLVELAAHLSAPSSTVREPGTT